MKSTETTKRDWKRRERAMGMGAILWSLAIGGVVAVSPNEVANWLLSTGGSEVAGAVMLSIGLLAGFCEAVLIAAERWTTNDDNELTEVPWE